MVIFKSLLHSAVTAQCSCYLDSIIKFYLDSIIKQSPHAFVLPVTACFDSLFLFVIRSGNYCFEFRHLYMYVDHKHAFDLFYFRVDALHFMFIFSHYTLCPLK